MNAGQINPKWLANARSNETENSTVADWFTAATNQKCEIDSEGSVWCNGSWLSQEQIDKICVDIDNGA